MLGLLAGPLPASSALSLPPAPKVPHVGVTVPSVPTVPVVTVPAPPVPVVTVPAPRPPKPPVVRLPTPPPLPRPPVVRPPAPPAPPAPRPPVVTVPAPHVKVPVLRPPALPAPKLAPGIPVPTIHVGPPGHPRAPSLPAIPKAPPTTGQPSAATGTASQAIRAVTRAGAPADQAGAPASSGSDGFLTAAGPFVGSTASLPSDSGYNSGLAALEESTSRAVSHLSPGKQARMLDAAVMATVRRLEGCLGYLPADVRQVLELRAGIHARPVLTAGAVAKQLHVTLRRVYRLERLGLRRLVRTARRHACAVAQPTPSEAILTGAVGPLPGGEPPAAGEVKGARYVKSPSPEAAGSATSGISEPPAAGIALLVFFAAVGGVLLVGLLFLDGVTAWPAEGDRRSSWMHHHPWNWHK
jgi:hypothetical protein